MGDVHIIFILAVDIKNDLYSLGTATVILFLKHLAHLFKKEKESKFPKINSIHII